MIIVACGWDENDEDDDSDGKDVYDDDEGNNFMDNEESGKTSEGINGVLTTMSFR